jgi:hypothetical protein
VSSIFLLFVFYFQYKKKEKTNILFAWKNMVKWQHDKYANPNRYRCDLEEMPFESVVDKN